MNILKRVALIFIIIVVGLLSFIIIKSIAKDDSSDLKFKVLTEIKFFESKLVNIYNSLNNVELENYQLSIEDVSEKSKKSSESSEDNKDNKKEDNGESNGGEQEKESSSSDKEGGQGGEDSNSSSNENKDKKFSLNPKGILSNNNTIKWDDIKYNAEILENSISSIILDLYDLSLNNLDLVNFTKDYDNLLIEIKNEDKQKTLDKINIVYSYLPRFIKNCDKDLQYEIVVNTKKSVFSAYSLLDTNNWNEIEKLLDNAIDTYSSLLTDINIKNKNQYIVNKCYITLNGLRNSVNLKDKEIFLIKYKNLLEDLNSL